MYYILDGTKVIETDLITWAKWFETADEKIIVAKTQIGDAKVSTVFLGLNHSLVEDDLPLIFETIIFGGKHDGDMWIYSTWDEAVKGHENAVAITQGHYKSWLRLVRNLVLHGVQRAFKPLKGVFDHS